MYFQIILTNFLSYASELFIFEKNTLQSSRVLRFQNRIQDNQDVKYFNKQHFEIKMKS